MSGIVGTTNESCQASNDATITISSLAGGSGLYDFSVDYGNTWSTAPTFTNLRVGMYDVVMRDRYSPKCTLQFQKTTLGYSEPLIIKSLDISGSCLDKNTGSASVELQGGSQPYTIKWRGEQYNSESFMAQELYSGNYIVDIKDSKGCGKSESFFVPGINCTIVEIGQINAHLCMDSIARIPYTLIQPISANNKLKVFISDSLGNFINGQFLDSVETQQSGAITVSLKNIFQGKKYRFRLHTTSPADISKPNSGDIQISTKPTRAIITGPVQTCLGSEPELNVQGATFATSFLWYNHKQELLKYDTLNRLSFLVSSAMHNNVMVQPKNSCGIGERVAYSFEVGPLATYPLIATSGISLTADNAYNYQWYFNEEPIPGGNTQSIQALRSGKYKVIINHDICPWQDSIHFTGITFNEVNQQLIVPEVAEATYEWYLNDQRLGGASDNVVRPVQTGTYTAVVTFNQPTARTSVMTQAVYEFYYVGKVTGVYESLENHIEVRPNPGHGTFYISSTTSLAGTTSSLYNTAGSVVARQQLVNGTEAALDYSEVPAGMYYLKLTGMGESGVKKLVVE